MITKQDKLTERWQWRTHVVLALVVATALRAGTFVVYQPWRDDRARQVVLTTDAVWQHRLACNLLDGHGFSIYESPPYAPHLIVPPLCPVLLAAIYATFGRVPGYGVGMNVAMSIVCVLVFFSMLRQLHHDWGIAALGMWLMVLSPNFIAYSNSLLMEQTFGLLFIVACMALIACVRTPCIFNAVITGLAWGLVNLAKFTALFVPLLIGIAWMASTSVVPLRRRLGLLLVVSAAFLVTVVPWQWRNYVRAGLFAYTSNKYINPLFFHMRCFRVAQTRGMDHDQQIMAYVEQVRKRSGTPFAPDTNSPVIWQMERAYRPADYYAMSEIFKEELKRDVLGYVAFHFSRIPVFFLAVPAHEWGRHLGYSEAALHAANLSLAAGDIGAIIRGVRGGNRAVVFVLVVTGVGMVYLLCVTIGAVAGAWYGLRSRGPVQTLTLFWVLWIGFIIAAVGPLAHSRYRMPADPALMALAAYGWNVLAGVTVPWRKHSKEGERDDA